MKRATTIQKQIEIYKERGFIIDDEDKIAEILGDIGYFRLGFYCFPFEESYNKNHVKIRNHKYAKNSKLSDVVDLYYLDADLRNILMKNLSRIEINFRTKIIYIISNAFIDSPTWFMDSNVMQQDFINGFDKHVYTEQFIKNNEVIRKHHAKYINDKYAPAWKTLEFLTFGAMFKLYQSVKSKDLQKEISLSYNIKNLKIFKNYMKTVLTLRNLCAHGGVLFDLKFNDGITGKGAVKIDEDDRHSLYSCIEVVEHILCQISSARAKDFKDNIIGIFNNHEHNPALKKIIVDTIKYKF